MLEMVQYDAETCIRCDIGHDCRHIYTLNNIYIHLCTNYDWCNPWPGGRSTVGSCQGSSCRNFSWTTEDLKNYHLNFVVFLLISRCVPREAHVQGHLRLRVVDCIHRRLRDLSVVGFPIRILATHPWTHLLSVQVLGYCAAFVHYHLGHLGGNWVYRTESNQHVWTDWYTDGVGAW